MNRFNLRTLIHSPFGRSLAVIMVAFTLVPIVILSAISLYNVQVQLRERSLAQANTVAGLALQTMTQWLGEASAQLAFTLKNPAFAQNSNFVLQTTTTDASRAEQVLGRDLNALTSGLYFSSTFLVRPDDSVVVASQPELKGQNLDIGLLNLERANQHAWGFDQLPALQQRVALIWQPVLDQRQQIAGFLVGQINLRNLTTVLQQHAVSLGQTGELYLIDRNQVALTAVRNASLESSPRLFVALMGGPYSGEFEDYAKQQVIGAIQPLPTPFSGWLAVHQQQAEAFDTYYALIRVAAVLSFSLIALAILAAVLITQQISEPLLRLSGAARAMAAGSFSTRVKIERRDEIGLLASTFNSMASDLQEAFGKLESSNQKLTTRAEQLSTITRVGQHATSLLDVDVLLPTLAREIQQALGYYAVAVYLPDPQKATLVGRAAAGIAADEFMAMLTRREIDSHSLVGAAATTRQVIHVPDVQLDSRYVAHPLRPATRSEVSIPLMVGTNLMGVLDIQSDKVRSFGADELEVLQILASQIAIAIRNAELFKESEVARQAADEANQQKSEFLSNMSHELRTPLNVIIGYSYSILNRPAMYNHVALPSVYEDGIRSIMTSGQHLLGLINDILDLSKIEAGQIDLSIEAMDPLPTLQGVRATALGLLKPGVQLRANYPDKLPDILGDELRVRQILLNLVSNAAKFTEHGSITLDAQVEDGHMRFSVADTGVGIPDEARPHIFDRFRQADRSVARKHGGTGLGLSISRQLCEMHGGKIWFESQVGKGTTFFFTIPLSKEERKATQPRPPEGWSEIVSSRAEIFTPNKELAQQAVVIDMQTESQSRIRTALSAAGYDVLVAGDAESGWDMAEAVLPNLVVIHIHEGDPVAMTNLAEKCRQHPDLSKLAVAVVHDLDEVGDPATLVERLLVSQPVQ